MTDNLRLIPVILASLSHRHVGVRFAACQCVRVLSRAVAVIRTNIVDSGLGLTVFEIFKKEDEDRHITNAALSAVCNIVNEFSPLRPVSFYLCILLNSFVDGVGFLGFYREGRGGKVGATNQHGRLRPPIKFVVGSQKSPP